MPRSYPVRGLHLPHILKCVLAVCLVLLAGCASVRERKQQSLFETTSREYENALLFGDYVTARSFVRVQGSARGDVDFKQLKKIKVTSYELLDLMVSEDGSIVTQTVEITYYHLDYMTETSLTDYQVWEYSPEEEAWRLQGGLPDFRH